MSKLKDHYEMRFDPNGPWFPISFRQLGEWLESADIKAIWNGETVKAKGTEFRCIVEPTESGNAKS